MRLCGVIGVLAAGGLAGVSCTRSVLRVEAAKSTTHGAQAATYSALHNVHRIGTGIISGGSPDGDAAFRELRALGVKTILSVDGSTPDVARAAAVGMRYVHVPITYAQATAQQQREVARVVRDLPGPIYIHCHHGKHRGPAAAASAAVLLGLMSASEGVEFLKVAGTSPAYPGLYACVAGARAASASEIDSAPGEFPSVRRPHGMKAAMVEVDRAFEHLGAIREAGWTTPTASPDLVPAAEAGRLADQLRFAGEDTLRTDFGGEFRAKLAGAVATAGELESALAAGAARESVEASWRRLGESCKDCHRTYRDFAR